MNTLIIFLPENGKKKSGCCDEYEINKKFLKIIYYRENLSGLGKFIFKIKVKKELRGAMVLENSFSEKIKAEKIYKDGVSLSLYHLNDILKKANIREPLTFYLSKGFDLNKIKKVIMSHKRLRFVTEEENSEELRDSLLEEYGISGAVFTDVNTGEAIILPGFKNNLRQGGKCAINLSGESEGGEGIATQDIFFTPPSPLRHISNVLRRADVLESVMDFFSLSYDTAKVSSVKFNKREKKENE